VPYEQFANDYLKLAAPLSQIFDDPTIFAIMLVTIPYPDIRRPFEEELKKKYQIDLIDYLSDGNFSKTQKEKAALAAALEAKEATIEASKATIEALKNRWNLLFLHCMLKTTL
jgi:hypothetical protein